MVVEGLIPLIEGYEGPGVLATRPGFGVMKSVIPLDDQTFFYYRSFYEGIVGETIVVISTNQWRLKYSHHHDLSTSRSRYQIEEIEGDADEIDADLTYLRMRL
jgi:hypothetical protein